MRSFIFTLLACLLGMEAFGAPTLWLAGDSIIRDYPEAELPRAGWGQMLRELVRPGVVIENRGLSGRSLKRFILDQNWEALLKGVKEGDFVILSFAHNDQYKNIPRYHDEPDEYGALLKQCIAEVRARGATPVLVTSIPRYRFLQANVPAQTLGEYPAVMREVAAGTDTGLIDLNTALTGQLCRLDMAESAKFYILDKQDPKRRDIEHLTREGARNVARTAVEEAKKKKLPIAELFQDK